MKKVGFFTLLFCFTLGFSGALLAHDMWTTADAPAAGQPLKLNVGYGHNFPAFEAIPDEELPYFQVKLLGQSGELPITASSSPNYQWTSKDPAQAGAYLFISDVKPIFWSQTPDGWVMKPKNEAKGATSCGYTIENAKGIINVGAPATSDLIGKPAGLPLEIVPKVNPSAVKPGDKVPLTVYLDGKPAPGVKVEGRFAGYDQLVGSPEARAFVSVSDSKGELTFVPLAAGDWILTARSEKPYEDLTKCDKTDYGTSLFFNIPK
ncbi:MAG: DUF4198 domain-containing protein [Deltaproteobacteria bacterium]|nr:DUF4198 domain-containing protein [Deltaproteobacteria bacterium]